jgi:hypothetical protein
LKPLKVALLLGIGFLGISLYPRIKKATKPIVNEINLKFISLSENVKDIMNSFSKPYVKVKVKKIKAIPLSTNYIKKKNVVPVKKHDEFERIKNEFEKGVRRVGSF